METVLVNCSRRSNQIQISIGYAVLMNSLKLHGIDRRLVDLIPIDPSERMDHFRRNLSPGRAIYAFGITIGNGQILEVEECARIIKEADPDNIIIYGGPLATSSAKILLANCLCDYVLGGEAENTFPELVRRLLKGEKCPDPAEIPGLYYRQRDGGVACKMHKKIGTLIETSNPDYSEFDLDFYLGYLKETDQSWEIMASRGCVANCTFCYKMVGSGLSIRPVDDVLNEMEMVINDYGLSKFYFVDDSLLVMRDWYRDFLKRKRDRGLECNFIIQSRIDAIDEELVRGGADNGLVCVSAGVESVNQVALDKMRKQIKVEEIMAKIALVKRFGLAFSANFIIGFEWETEADWQEMYNFIQDNLPGQVKLNILTPLPNTFIYRQAKERGLIGDEYEYIKKMGDLYFELMVNMTSMPNERLLHWYHEIQTVASRDIAFPTSKRYLSKLAAHYYQRFPEEKRFHPAAAPAR